MLEFFRSNTLFSIIGLVLFTILLRMATFFVAVPIEIELHTPFAQVIFDWLHNHQLFGNQNQFIATTLLLLQAFLINYISSSHDILYKNSVLPGLFYVLLNSIYPSQLLLSPQLLSATFVILMFNRLCYLYESSQPLFLVFDSGILLGLGLLLDYDMIVYLPFILLSVLYMTSFNLRYWLVAIFGIVVPAYFLGVLFYLTDHLNDFLNSFEFSFTKSYYHPIGMNYKEGIIWFFILPAFALSALALQSNFFKNKVKTRRVQLILMVLLLFGVVSVLAENQGYIYGLAFLAVPLSIVLANYFIRSKRKIFKELLFFGMLGSIIYYHYLNK